VRHAIVGPSVLPQYRADAMLTKRFGASSTPVGRVGLTKSPWKMTSDQCGINPDQPVVTVRPWRPGDRWCARNAPEMMATTMPGCVGEGGCLSAAGFQARGEALAQQPQRRLPALSPCDNLRCRRSS